MTTRPTFEWKNVNHKRSPLAMLYKPIEPVTALIFILWYIFHSADFNSCMWCLSTHWWTVWCNLIPNNSLGHWWSSCSQRICIEVFTIYNLLISLLLHSSLLSLSFFSYHILNYNCHISSFLSVTHYTIYNRHGQTPIEPIFTFETGSLEISTY